VEVKAPISNTRFFAGRTLKTTPRVQLRSAPGSRNQALTPIGQKGFTYLGIMIIIMVMGMGLAAFGTIYSQTAQRDKEAELLFVGEQFRSAIESYVLKGPDRTYPKKLEDLVEDKRFPMPMRHLRRIYPDPITGSTDWGLVEMPGNGGIMGVFSKSEEKPIKQGNFIGAKQEPFEDAESYTKWTFTYSPPSSGQTAAPAVAQSTTR
jgi:type II secretory pathway pseudopilin PulG